MSGTGKTIQFVDGQPLLSLLESWENREINAELESQMKSKPRRHSSVTNVATKILSRNSVSPRGDSRNVIENVISRVHKPMLNESGHILSSTHFASSKFKRNFSSRTVMRPESDFRFLFVSGSIRDLLTYGILHSGNSKFGKPIILSRHF